MRKTGLFYFLFLLISCFSNKQENPVLLENFVLPKDMNPTLSSLFTKKHEITPLETTTGCLIGRIDKIKKLKGYYYILSDSESIYKFDNQGAFISSLNRKGQGPEEYHRIEDFDTYEIDGETEVWISDNKSLKIYDANDFKFKYQIPYPFVIHKFKRLKNSNILLVTGQNDNILTITDKKGNIISENLKKEIPFIMFRPIQFIEYNSEYIFQLGISNSYISFNQETEEFQKGFLSKEKSFISAKELINLFEKNGIDYLREINKSSYINNLIVLNNNTWVHSFHMGKNYLTKIQPGLLTSTSFSLNSTIKNDLFDLDSSSFISTIMTGESDDSILLYIDSNIITDSNKRISDKFGQEINIKAEDNPCIVEFY